VLAELVTLVAAGSALWLQLVESPPLLPRLSRPLRAVFAALAMWSIWILAYILGFSQVAWFRAYLQPGGEPGDRPGDRHRAHVGGVGHLLCPRRLRCGLTCAEGHVGSRR